MVCVMEETEGRLQWYAVYTKSRREKVLAKHLEAAGVVHFLPLLERKKKWSDRYKIVHEPLFNGYLFVNVAWGEHYQIVDAPGFVRFIGFESFRPLAIPQSEIEAVRIAIEYYGKCDPHSHLRIGQAVRVNRGPLKGYEGQLDSKEGRYRLILSVTIIGRSISVEIDAADVEPA